MPKYILLFFFLTIFTIDLNAQFTEEWSARYITPEKDLNSASSRMVKDSEGNIYVSGSTKNHYSYILIKYNSAGVEQWTRYYEGTRETCIAACLGVDQNDNIIISGEWGSGANGDDIVTIKYKPNGDSIWTRHYDDSRYPSSEWGRDMVLDDSGNIYIAGMNHADIGNNTIVNMGVVIKIDSSGNLEWDRFIAEDTVSTSEIDLWQIEIDNAGYIYVGGDRTFYGDHDVIISKYSPSGNQIWNSKFAGRISSFFNGMFTDSDGTSYVVGSNRALTQFLVLKFDDDGNRLWNANYVASAGFLGELPTCGASVCVNDSGSVFVAGFSNEYELWTPTSRVSLTTVKYNSSGTQQWYSSNIYESAYTGYSRARAILLDNSDNLIVQGLRYYPAISHSYDHLLIKYSNSGDILYENIYDNGGDDGGGDWLEPMLIDDSNHIFVSFESEQSDSTSILDIVTIKYSHSNDDRLLKSKTNTIPSKYSLAQNFPNPFNPSTLINYSIRENGSVKLEVYNVLGEKIKTLINEYQNSGHKSVVWDGTNDNGYKVASGLYIYKFVAGNYTNIKKMILIK